MQTFFLGGPLDGQLREVRDDDWQILAYDDVPAPWTAAAAFADLPPIVTYTRVRWALPDHEAAVGYIRPVFHAPGLSDLHASRLSLLAAVGGAAALEVWLRQSRPRYIGRRGVGLFAGAEWD